MVITCYFSYHSLDILYTVSLLTWASTGGNCNILLKTFNIFFRVVLLKRSIYIKKYVRCRVLWISSQYYTWRKRRALCCYMTFSKCVWFVVWMRTSPDCSLKFEKYIKDNCCGCLERGLFSHNTTAEKHCTLHQGMKWLSFCRQQRTRQTVFWIIQDMWLQLD